MQVVYVSVNCAQSDDDQAKFAELVVQAEAKAGGAVRLNSVSRDQSKMSGSVFKR